MGFEEPWPNWKQYLPPTRTSTSQQSSDTPVDFGAHEQLGPGPRLEHDARRGAEGSV
jgi:hypothetical protein